MTMRCGDAPERHKRAKFMRRTTSNESSSVRSGMTYHFKRVAPLELQFCLPDETINIALLPELRRENLHQ